MRTKKVFYNVASSLIYQIVLMASGLIVPKLILEEYGSACNGVVASANQFMGVISLLTIGLTGATRVELYKSLAENDTDKIGQIMKSTNKYMHKVAMALVIYTFVLASVYPYISHTELSSQIIISLILVVGLGKFFEYFLGIPYRILLQADQKNYIEYSLMIGACVIYTFLTILMIHDGKSIISVKSMNAIVSLVAMLIICGYAKKCYKLKWNTKSKPIKLAQRKDAAIHSIANIIHQNSDLVILTLFTDIKMVSIYSVYYYVIGQIKKLMGSFTEGLESAFGNMWAKGELTRMKEKFYVYEYFVFVLVAVVFSCVWILIIPFITLYTEKVTDVSYVWPVLAGLITITELIYCIRQPYVTIVQAAGRYKETKNIAIIESSTNLLVSVVLVFEIGIYGVIVGTLVANLIRTGFYMWYSAEKILLRDYKEIIKRILWFLIMFLFCVLIESQLIEMIRIDSWGKWVFTGVVMVLVSSGVALIASLVFERKSIIELWNTIKKIR